MPIAIAIKRVEVPIGIALKRVEVPIGIAINFDNNGWLGSLDRKLSCQYIFLL